MSVIIKPDPLDQEVMWDKNEVIVSKTDLHGTILEVNDAFCKVSGYAKNELLRQPHNIIRHPDMPKSIFKFMWDSLKKGENFYGIVKNLSKSGEYYWVLTDFDILKDKNGSIINYQAKRIAIPEELIVSEIIPLYNRILKLEEYYGVDGGQNYLNGFLEKKKQSYIEYVHSIIDKYANSVNFFGYEIVEKESSSFLKRLFRLK